MAKEKGGPAQLKALWNQSYLDESVDSVDENSALQNLKSRTNTVPWRVFGPPKRRNTKLLGVKTKNNLQEKCIQLKFSPLLTISANFMPIGQLLYKQKIRFKKSVP